MNNDLLKRIESLMYTENGVARPGMQVTVYRRKSTKSKKYLSGYKWEKVTTTDTLSSGILADGPCYDNPSLFSFHDGKETKLNTDGTDFSHEYLYVVGKMAFAQPLGEVTMATAQDHHGKYYHLVRTDYRSGSSDYRFTDRGGLFRGNHRCNSLYGLLHTLEHDFDTEPAILNMIDTLRKKPYERIYVSNHREGICPMCGYAVEYTDTIRHDKGWECPLCGSTGNEEICEDGETVQHHNVKDHKEYRFTWVSPEEIMRPGNSIFDVIRESLPRCRVKNGNYWTEDGMILCSTEGHADALVDLLKSSGVAAASDCYRPLGISGSDEDTVWYSVSVEKEINK